MTDGGAAWTKVASRPATFIRAIGFVNARTAFLGDTGTDHYPGTIDTTPLYRTGNDGKTWIVIDLAAGPKWSST